MSEMVKTKERVAPILAEEQVDLGEEGEKLYRSAAAVLQNLEALRVSLVDMKSDFNDATSSRVDEVALRNALQSHAAGAACEIKICRDSGWDISAISFCDDDDGLLFLKLF